MKNTRDGLGDPDASAAEELETWLKVYRPVQAGEWLRCIKDTGGTRPFLAGRLYRVFKVMPEGTGRQLVWVAGSPNTNYGFQDTPMPGHWLLYEHFIRTADRPPNPPDLEDP